MKPWLRAHGTIAAAILTLVFGFIAAESLVSAIDPSRLDTGFGTGLLMMDSNNAPGARGAAANASAIIGVAMGAVVVTSAVIVVGLAFRCERAREAGLVGYGFLGLVSIAASMGGLAADPPATARDFRYPATGRSARVS